MANFLSDLQKKYSDILNPINQGLSSYAHGVQQRFNTPSKIAPPPAQNNSIRSFINPIVNEAKNIVTQQIPSFQRFVPLTQPFQNPVGFLDAVKQQTQNFQKNGLNKGAQNVGMDAFNSAKLGANVLGGSKMLAGGPLNAVKTILPNAVIGGGFNKLTGGSFSEGAGKGVAISPSIRGITGITNPLIEKYTQLLAPRIAPQLTNSAVGNYLTTSTLRGLQNIPEGAVIDATLGNRPMGTTSMMLDFASGFIPGSPNIRNQSSVYNVDVVKPWQKAFRAASDQAVAERINIAIKNLDDEFQSATNVIPKKYVDVINEASSFFLPKEAQKLPLKEKMDVWRYIFARSAGMYTDKVPEVLRGVDEMYNPKTLLNNSMGIVDKKNVAQQPLSDIGKLKYHTPQQVADFKNNILTPSNTQKTLSDFQSVGGNLNQDGSITLYRGASSKLSDNIRPQSYFTTELKTAKKFGTVSEIKVDPQALMSQGKSMATGGITFINPAEMVKGSDGVYRVPSPPQPSTLSKIKSTLKDQRGFIKFGEFVPPYKKGDVSKLKQGLKDELSTLPKPGGNKSRMEMLEYYAKQGDEAAQAQLELIRSMEQNIKLAQETKLSGKITPQGKSTKPSSPEIIPQSPSDIRKLNPSYEKEFLNRLHQTEAKLGRKVDPTSSRMLYDQLLKQQNESYLYHGTTPEAIQSIKALGFKPIKGNNEVYFATHPDVTKQYGKSVIKLAENNFDLLDSSSERAKNLRMQAGLDPNDKQAVNQTFRELVKNLGWDGYKYKTDRLNADVEIYNTEKLNNVVKQSFRNTERQPYGIKSGRKVSINLSDANPLGLSPEANPKLDSFSKGLPGTRVSGNSTPIITPNITPNSNLSFEHSPIIPQSSPQQPTANLSQTKKYTQLGSATNTRADQIAGKFRSPETLQMGQQSSQGKISQAKSQEVLLQPTEQQPTSRLLKDNSKIAASNNSIQPTVKSDFEAEMDAQIGKTFEKPFSGKSRVKAKQPVDLPGDQATTDFATGRMAMGDGGGIKGLPKDTSDQFQLWVNRRRATDIEGFLKKKEFKDLDNKGVNGIFEFQAGNKSGRFGDVKRYFDAKYKTLQDNKIEFDYRQDYLPQLWNNSQDEINQVFGRRLGTKPSFTLEALFKSYEEGMNAGLKPKFGNISDLVGWYEQKANKALADKRFFDYLGHDGQILPSGKAPQEWVTLDPDRFPKFLSQIGDEQFAGTYKAPKELADVINNYLQGARFPFLEKVAGYVSKVKNITLNFGIPGTGINMHGVNILARHTLMGTGGNPISRFITGGKFMLAPNLAAKELDKSMINAPQAVKNGLSLSAEDYSGLTRQGEGFRAQFGRKWEAMFGDPLFNKMIPALKLSSYENLVKNGMNEKDAAKLINNVYGGINWEQMGRSKDIQNLVRIAILAPDWAESTLKIGGNFAKALNPLERSETVGRYRTMMATVFASYIAHNIVNKITSGHYSYENDPSNIFNIEIGYTDSGEKRYFRPYGTGLDMVRLPAEVAMGLYKGDLTGITRLVRNRLSIPAGVGLGLLTDQDYRNNAIGYRGTDKYGNEMPIGQRVGNITSEMASLVGVPAFTRQLYRGVSGQQGLEESLTQGLELPFRYSNTGNSNVQKQVDFIADEQGLKGKDRYDFNQQLKGQSKFSDNQLNVIKSYDNKSQGLKDTLQLRKVRSEVEKAKKGSLKEGGINQADAAEETPITTNSNMQLEIAKSRVKMTKKTERVGDNIVYPTETGSSTLSLTPPTKGSGIGAYANKDWNITKAREVWNNDQLSKEDKDYAFKKLNVKAEDVRYDALANYSNDIKSQYLSSKSDTKEKLINNILTGRKRSIGDNIFASDGVIDSLVDEGKLTKEEGKALKAIDYNKDGSRKIKVGSGRGKKIKIPKVKAITIKFNKRKRIKVRQIKPKKVKQYKLSKVTKVKKLKV